MPSWWVGCGCGYRRREKGPMTATQYPISPGPQEQGQRHHAVRDSRRQRGAGKAEGDAAVSLPWGKIRCAWSVWTWLDSRLANRQNGKGRKEREKKKGGKAPGIRGPQQCKGGPLPRPGSCRWRCIQVDRLIHRHPRHRVRWVISTVDAFPPLSTLALPS